MRTPLDKFLHFIYGGPLRSISLLTINAPPPPRSVSLLTIWRPLRLISLLITMWGPLQISFFAYYMGPPQVSFYVYRAPQISFYAYYRGPSNQFLCLLYRGPLLDQFFLHTIWGPLRSVSSLTVWGPPSGQFLCLLWGPLKSIFSTMWEHP